MTNSKTLPDPSELLEAANQEAVIKGGRGFLQPYAETVLTLHRKGYSYKKIAEWLTNHGVSCTLNGVASFARKLERDALAEQQQKGGESDA